MSNTVASEVTASVICTQVTGDIGLISTYGFAEGPTFASKDWDRWCSILPPTRANPNHLGGHSVGVLTITKSLRLAVLFLPRSCTDLTDQQFLLGTKRNHMQTVEPRLLPHTALRNFLAICPKSLGPKGCLWSETPLDLSKPELAALITRDMKDDFPQGEDIFVARVPIAIPLPGGHDKVIMGSVCDQAVTDFVHAVHGDSGTNWLACVLRWTEAHHDVLLHNKTFETYLPKARSNANLYDVPFVQQSIGDLEDDDNLINAVEHLELDCGKFLADVQRAAQDSRAPFLGKTVNLGGGESPVDDIPDVPKIDKTQALRNRVHGTLLLLSANFEKGTTERLAPGKLSSLAQLVVGSSSQKEMAAMMRSGMTATKDTFEQSFHFLLRKVNPQQHQPVVEAFAGTVVLDTKKKDTLEDKNVLGLNFLHFLPDNKATLLAKSKDSNKSVAEDALGESAEKRSKLSTDFTPVDSITGVEDVLTAIANDLVWWVTFLDIDIEAMYATECWPIFCEWMVGLAKVLSGPDAKEYLRTNRSTPNEVKLAYYCVHALNTLHVKVAQFASDVVHQTKALRLDWDSIPTKIIKKAHRYYENVIEQLEGVFDESITVPESVLWNNSKVKEDADRKKLMLLRQQLNLNKPAPSSQPASVTPAKKNGKVQTFPAATAEKKSKTHNNPANLGEDGKDGYIIVPAGKHFNVPQALNGPRPGSDFSLCKAFYQKGKSCRHGQSCNRDHSAPKDLPAEQGKLLWEFMSTNEHGLCWNETLVDVAALAAAFGSTQL